MIIDDLHTDEPYWINELRILALILLLKSLSFTYANLVRHLNIQWEYRDCSLNIIQVNAL